MTQGVGAAAAIIAPVTQDPYADHWIATEGGTEYFYSCCKHCDMPHQRQRIIRLSKEDMERWKSPCANHPVKKGIALLCVVLSAAIAYWALPATYAHGYYGQTTFWSIMLFAYVAGAIGILIYMDGETRKVRRAILQKYGTYDFKRVWSARGAARGEWEPRAEESWDYLVIEEGGKL